MGVVVAAAVIDAVVLVTAALVWHFFGHRIRAFVRETDLEQVLRRLWNHRPRRASE